MRIILPLLVLTFIFGILPIARDAASSSTPTYQELQAAQAVEIFVAYAHAVEAFQGQNPTYVGSVSQAQLAAMGFQASSQFFGSAGNAITATGSSGRIVTAYSTLAAGGLSSISAASGGDASFGTSSGNTWTSIASGSSAQPLAIAVPNSSAVSVFQVGS